MPDARTILTAIGWKPGGGKVKRTKNTAILGGNAEGVDNPVAYKAAILRREFFETAEVRSPIHGGDWLVRRGYDLPNPFERARAIRDLRIPNRERGNFLRICAAWVDSECP